jgi:hypothetical protein
MSPLLSRLSPSERGPQDSGTDGSSLRRYHPSDANPSVHTVVIICRVRQQTYASQNDMRNAQEKKTRSVHRWRPNGQNMNAVVMAMVADAVNSVRVHQPLDICEFGVPVDAGRASCTP